MPMSPGEVRAAIVRQCDALKATLLEKNAAYGNSALDPVRIFSKASPREQILVRIDDKVSRIARGHEAPGEDVFLDLAGYCILLLTQQALARAADENVVQLVGVSLSGGG